jgi:DNA (cytosine-5)-methyltransferase 1
VTVFYNDNNPHACGVLRRRIADGSLSPGIVDDRAIQEIGGHELHDFRQVHLFAGIGGFPLGARMAGVPDDFSLCTGGFPCQPYSCAGKREGIFDHRDLWPEMFRIIGACRPRWVFGENVPGLDDKRFMALDRTCVDLESIGYEVGPPLEIPACAVNAPHKRSRLWIIARRLADGNSTRLAQREGVRSDDEPQRQATQRNGVANGHVVDRPSERWGKGRPEPEIRNRRPAATGSGFWDGTEWAEGGDGKYRRTKSGIRLLVNGLPRRVAEIAGYGNAIVPQVFEQICRAMLAAEGMLA